jgi:hypothetical protein
MMESCTLGLFLSIVGATFVIPAVMVRHFQKLFQTRNNADKKKFQRKVDFFNGLDIFSLVFPPIKTKTSHAKVPQFLNAFRK